MAKKGLPDDEAVLKHLLAVAKDCLDFMEPAVRPLEHPKKPIEAAVLEPRFDIPLFRKVHEALTDRRAQGGPSYAALLPYWNPASSEGPWRVSKRRRRSWTTAFAPKAERMMCRDTPTGGRILVHTALGRLPSIPFSGTAPGGKIAESMILAAPWPA